MYAAMNTAMAQGTRICKVDRAFQTVFGVEPKEFDTHIA